MIDLEARIHECRGRWTSAPRSRAFIPLADVLRQAGRWEEALAVLEAGFAHHPNAVGGLVTLARSLLAAGREAEAAEAAGRALELDPENLVALELLAESDRQRGDLRTAIGRYERLVQLAPGDRHWPGVLSRLREEQTTSVDVAEGTDGGPGFATLTLVDLYLAQGYRLKAEHLLRRLAGERPDDPEVMRRLAALPAAAMPSGGDGLREATSPEAGGRDLRPAAERREQAREQFARWVERIRSEREVTP